MALTFVGSSALFSVYDFHDSTDIFVEYIYNLYIIEILVICEGCNYVNSVNVNYVIHNFWVQLAWYDNVIIYILWEFPRDIMRNYHIILRLDIAKMMGLTKSS